MKENASERAKKYIETTTASLQRLKPERIPAVVKEAQFQYVLEMARRYVDDAEHYSKSRKPVTSLACIAYAEGLLDVLKFLELVTF